MYNIQCDACKTTGKAQGSYDPETNATEIDEESVVWDEDYEDSCEHQTYTIVNEEIDDSLD